MTRCAVVRFRPTTVPVSARRRSRWRRSAPRTPTLRTTG